MTYSYVCKFSLVDQDITERLDTLNNNINERLSERNNDVLIKKLDTLNSNINGRFDTVNGRFDVLNSTMNGRLDSLENSVEEIKSTAGQCCNDSTGSFLDPAHNCSHILHDHSGSHSGNDIHTSISALILVSTVCRLLLVTEQPWLCSEGVL